MTLHLLKLARLRKLGAIALGVLLITGCGGSGGGPDTYTPPGPGGPSNPDLDLRLVTLAVDQLGLTGDPATPRGMTQTIPDDDPLVKLGQLLFFSQTLAAGYDISCGTCHHTDFGGSDGLSISVGVVPRNAAAVGPGREVDPQRDPDPRADGGPNMHRNSITTFNAALFDRSVMLDGRVFSLEANTVPGAAGQLIQTPESGQRPDPEPLSGLLEFTMKLPIVNDNEMRGFMYTEYPTPVEYREHLVRRLQGEVDTEYNPKADGPENWLQRFREAFGMPTAEPDEVISMLNIQRALAAYIASKTFVDTPWRDYLNGSSSAISVDAKRGALLFHTPLSEGGLGCAACHSGDRFSDESFHNVGFPQLGRGFLRADRTDLGRWNISRADEDMFAFRTPSLLNVATTAPYGHSGSFATLEDLLMYHADPRAGVDMFDFSLSHLEQFWRIGITYQHAEAHTRTSIEEPGFAEHLLPARQLRWSEIQELVAFLNTLTDRCVADHDCISQWAPGEHDDPDGHTLIRDESLAFPPEVISTMPGDYPPFITMQFPPTFDRQTFADVENCENGLLTVGNTGLPMFLRRDEDPAFGLNDRHRYRPQTWFDRINLEVTMIGGGVSAAYLTDDCWPDLIFTSGVVPGVPPGMRIYRNSNGTMFESVDMITGLIEPEYTGAAIADLNGNYRRELILGNIKSHSVPVLARDEAGYYSPVASLPMARPTYGISFAPLDATGYPYLFLAHWGATLGTDGTSPALWRNDGTTLTPWDVQAQTSSAFIDQRFNFTPRFADFTGNGRLDLVIASDFRTSVTLRNIGDASGGPLFVNETVRRVVSDENGMGSALLDINNDGNLEWFVTSIYDRTGNKDPETDEPVGNWGISGNRLYRNVSTHDRIAFEDITEDTGLRDGHWGWGACAADFNNDGFIDLFHVNGFGYIPDDVVTSNRARLAQEHYDKITEEVFQNKPPRLFINNGNRTFAEEATPWNIDVPSEGRGVVCFDYDRDGDIDIVVFDHSTGLQFFENQIGSGPGSRFLNVRLVGNSPNTDAIGARIYATANVGHGNGVQTQMRLSEANSNFNSQNLPDIHFGVGEASLIDELRVVWPNGDELVCEGIAANQFIVIDQRDGGMACPAGGQVP